MNRVDERRAALESVSQVAMGSFSCGAVKRNARILLPLVHENGGLLPRAIDMPSNGNGKEDRNIQEIR